MYFTSAYALPTSLGRKKNGERVCVWQTCMWPWCTQHAFCARHPFSGRHVLGAHRVLRAQIGRTTARSRPRKSWTSAAKTLQSASKQLVQLEIGHTKASNRQSVVQKQKSAAKYENRPRKVGHENQKMEKKSPHKSLKKTADTHPHCIQPSHFLYKQKLQIGHGQTDRHIYTHVRRGRRALYNRRCWDLR